MIHNPFFSSANDSVLRVERAIGDLRRGYGVIVDNTMLVMAADTVAIEAVNQLCKKHPPTVILSAKRSKWLFGTEKAQRYTLPLPVDHAEMSRLIEDITEKPRQNAPIHEANTRELSALQLIKHAELLPAALIIPTDEIDLPASLLSLSSEDIYAYKNTLGQQLTEICRAPLCLKGAEDASIIAFRPPLGGSEHYAIIIGKALESVEPLIRVHSSCYTGDLLDSLKCDCGDQLHEAIHFMGKQAEGGIILYLMQEGRGIGLTNKLRAYDVQSHGVDTVDANEILGFDDDERLFLPATQMLTHLSIHTVRLLTNNPRKAKSLEEHNIKVSTCVPHVMQANPHNRSYLSTKAERLGHNLPYRSDN